MADPLFDPRQQSRQLEDAFRTKQQSQGKVRDVLIDTQEELTDINRDYAHDLNLFGVQTDRINNLATDALDRLDAIDSNPEIFNRVMSLFDEKYSRSTQERKLQRAQFETARLATQMSNKEDLRQLRLQEASQGLQLADQLYQFDQQNFLDQAKLLEIGFQVEAQIDKRTVDLANNATLEQITTWRDDITKAPKALQSRPGLVELVYYEKASTAQGFTDAKQFATLREFQIQQLNQNKLLAEMDDETLAEAVNTRNLPAGLSYGVAADEWERRQEVDYGLHALRNAQIEGDMRTELNAKNFVLGKMKLEEITLMLNQANSSRDGQVSFQTPNGALRFTQQELENAHEAALQRDLAIQKARNDMLIGSAGLEGQLDKATTSVSNVAALANPGTGQYTQNPVDSLPSALRSDVRKLQQQIKFASGLPGGARSQIELVNQLQITLDDAAEKIIEGKPDKQKPAYREFYRDGIIQDAEANAQYLAQALPNSSTLASDLVYGPIWEQFGTEYLEIAGQDVTTFDLSSTNPDSANAGITISKTGKPNDVDVLEKAAKKTREYAKGVVFQSYAAETLLRLEKQFEGQMARTNAQSPLNIWSGIVNPNTLRFSESVQDPQTGAFDLGRFSQLLAAKTTILRAKGVLQPDESLNQMLENTMRNRQNLLGYVGEISLGSMEKAAVNHALFGNNMSHYVGQAVNDFGAYTNTTLSVADERAIELEKQVTSVVRNPPPNSRGEKARALGLKPGQFGWFGDGSGTAVIDRARELRPPTASEPGDDLMIEFFRQHMGN